MPIDSPDGSEFYRLSVEVGRQQEGIGSYLLLRQIKYKILSQLIH
ncbi:hypothetical protein [Limnobaculum xujianqingii]|nr:hypothetical protein [Limnobaculum xujianqingii]